MGNERTEIVLAFFRGVVVLARGSSTFVVG